MPHDSADRAASEAARAWGRGGRGSQLNAVEPGSLFDSPANWTPKAWTSACYVCELDRQPQADICHPDFTKLKERTVDAVRATLEALGAEFTNGDAPGVKIRAS
jgi:hypothetical protein